ncbi:MAG: cold shock domain-containing protein [Longimicrobiales bacterium]
MRDIDEKDGKTSGTVEWYDAERGVGAIRPDDNASPCQVRSETLRACGIDGLATGDRVRFRIRDEAGGRTAQDVARIRAIQRWENEGGAIAPDQSGT